MKDKHIQSFNEHKENLNSELSKETSSSISVVSDSKIFTMTDIENLRKNLYGIVPLGQHRKMFNEMFDEWIKNPNCKPKYG